MSRIWTLVFLILVASPGGVTYAQAQTDIAPLSVAALHALGREPTLTGRTEIWRAAQPYLFLRPLTGLGFNYTGSPAMVARAVAPGRRSLSRRRA